MPRDTWVGTLSFGLVVVPVRMVKATRDRDVHLHLVDSRSMERVEIRRIAETDGREVPWDQIGHGYDLDGQLVVLTDEDLTAVAPERTHTIEIEEFVALEELDPAQFDQHYFLLANSKSEGAIRAYRLLRDTMAADHLTAIGRVVLRTEERVVAVHVRDELLSMTTLLFADELRDAGKTAVIPDEDPFKPSRQELSEAAKLIDKLAGEFDPKRYQDRHRERLMALVDAQQGSDSAEASEPDAAPAPAPDASRDLLAALKASLDR